MPCSLVPTKLAVRSGCTHIRQSTGQSKLVARAQAGVQTSTDETVNLQSILDDPGSAAQHVVSQAEQAVLEMPEWDSQSGSEFLTSFCGHYVLASNQICVLQQLRQQMMRVSRIAVLISITYILAGLVESTATGTANSLAINGANGVHNLCLAILVAVSARSFTAVADASRDGDNALPHLMLALSRLSVVLSQFSAAATCMAVINIVGATVQWPALALFAAFMVAGAMIARMAASFYLLAELGGTGSVMNTIAAIQRNVNSTSLKQKIDKVAVMVSASNMVHYPVLDAFSPIKALNRISQNREIRKQVAALARAKKAADREASIEDIVERAAGAGAEERGGTIDIRQQTVDDSEIDRGSTQEEYEFNDGENMILQILCDEMRMAGYNNVLFSFAVILMAVAHANTDSWLMFLMSIMLCVDTCGTAFIFFLVTRQFETAVVTSGSDIAALLRGLSLKQGLTGLFKRVGDLSSGVVYGHMVICMWHLRHYWSAMPLPWY